VAEIAFNSRSTGRLVLVSGWTGTGKSTLAGAIASDIHGTVASFDWLMSGLRVFPEIWPMIEEPRDRQRQVAWALLSRVAEQQLRRGAACVLDLVARETIRMRWQGLANELTASFHTIECICSDPALHRKMVGERSRAIPGWYEITFDDALRVRQAYEPLKEPKLILDAVDGFAQNLRKARTYLGLSDV
jgi:predicted kinase